MIERRSKALNRLYQRHAEPDANNSKVGLQWSRCTDYSANKDGRVHRWDDVQKFCW